MTSSVESLYEMFLSDPDIVATATKSREEVAFGEAKQRFIQSMNNHKALSLAKSGPVEDLLSFLRYGNLVKADDDILRRDPTTNKLSVDAPEAAGISHEDLVSHLKDEFMQMHRPEGDTEFPHTFDDIANDPELSTEALNTARLTQDNLYLHGLRPGRQGEYSPEEEVEDDDNVEKVEDDEEDDEEEGTDGEGDEEETLPREELDDEETGGTAKYGVDFAEATAQHGMHQDTPLNMPGGPVIGYDALKHLSDRAQTLEAKNHMESLNHAVANFNSTQLGLQQGTPIDGHDWDSIDPTVPGQSFRDTHEQKSLNHLRRIAVGLKYAAENRDAFSHPGIDGDVVHQHTFSPLQNWHLDNVQGPEGSKDKLRQEVLKQYDFKQHHGNPPAVDDLIQNSANKLGLTLGTPSDDLLRRDNAHRSELPRGETLTRRFVKPGETRPEDMSMEQLGSWAMNLDVTPEEFTKVTNEGVESGRYSNEDVDNTLLALTNMPMSREDLANKLGEVEKFSSHAEMEEAATKHMSEFGNIITDPETGIKEYNPEKAKAQRPPSSQIDREAYAQKVEETKLRTAQVGSRERQQKLTRGVDTGDREPALATEGRPDGVAFKEGHEPHFPDEENMRLFSSDLQQAYGRFRPIMQSLITLGVPLEDFTNPSDKGNVWSLNTFQRGLRKWGFINHDDSITGETGKNNTPRIMPGQPFERTVGGRKQQWGGSGHQAYNRRQALFKNFDATATPEQRTALDAVKTTKRVKDGEEWKTVELNGREAILHHLDSSANTGLWINAMGYTKETKKSKAGKEYTKNARPPENYKTVPEKNTRDKEDNFNWNLARDDWSPEQVDFFHNNILKEGDRNARTPQNSPKFVKREGGDSNLESKHLDRLLGMAADEHGGIGGGTKGRDKETMFEDGENIDLAEYPPLRGYQTGSAYPGLDYNEQDVQDHMRVSAERRQQIADHPNSRATFIANLKQQFNAAHEGQQDVDYHTINNWFKDNQLIKDNDIPVPQHLEGKLEKLPTPPSSSAVQALQDALQSRLPGNQSAEAPPAPEGGADKQHPNYWAALENNEIIGGYPYDMDEDITQEEYQRRNRETPPSMQIGAQSPEHWLRENVNKRKQEAVERAASPEAVAERQRQAQEATAQGEENRRIMREAEQEKYPTADEHAAGKRHPAYWAAEDGIEGGIGAIHDKSLTREEYDELERTEGLQHARSPISPERQQALLQRHGGMKEGENGDDTPPVTQAAPADEPEEIGGANVRVVRGTRAVKQAHDAEEGVSMIRPLAAQQRNDHYGNPFGVGDRTAGVHNVETNQNAVNAHEAWLHKSPEYAKDSRTGDLLSYWDREAGESKNIWLGEGEGPKGEQPVKPEQRDWILQQIKSGALNNKDLLYHQEIRNTEGGRSHASNIEDMVNTYQGNPAGEDFREDYPEGEGVEQQPPTAVPAAQPAAPAEQPASAPEAGDAPSEAAATPTAQPEAAPGEAQQPEAAPTQPAAEATPETPASEANDDIISPEHTPSGNIALTGEDTELDFNNTKEVHDKAKEEHDTLRTALDNQIKTNADAMTQSSETKEQQATRFDLNNRISALERDMHRRTQAPLEHEVQLHEAAAKYGNGPSNWRDIRQQQGIELNERDGKTLEELQAQRQTMNDGLKSKESFGHRDIPLEEFQTVYDASERQQNAYMRMREAESLHTGRRIDKGQAFMPHPGTPGTEGDLHQFPEKPIHPGEAPSAQILLGDLHARQANVSARRGDITAAESRSANDNWWFEDLPEGTNLTPHKSDAQIFKPFRDFKAAMMMSPEHLKREHGRSTPPGKDVVREFPGREDALGGEGQWGSWITGEQANQEHRSRIRDRKLREMKNFADYASTYYEATHDQLRNELGLSIPEYDSLRRNGGFTTDKNGKDVSLEGHEERYSDLGRRHFGTYSMDNSKFAALGIPYNEASDDGDEHFIDTHRPNGISDEAYETLKQKVHTAAAIRERHDAVDPDTGELPAPAPALAEGSAEDTPAEEPAPDAQPEQPAAEVSTEAPAAAAQEPTSSNYIHNGEPLSQEGEDALNTWMGNIGGMHRAVGAAGNRRQAPTEAYGKMENDAIVARQHLSSMGIDDLDNIKLATGEDVPNLERTDQFGLGGSAHSTKGLRAKDPDYTGYEHLQDRFREDTPAAVEQQPEAAPAAGEEAVQPEQPTAAVDDDLLRDAPRPGESQEERASRVAAEEQEVEEQDTQHGELQSDPTNQVANSPTPHGYTSMPDNPRDMTEQAKEDQMQAMVEHLKPRMKNQAAVNYLQGLRDTMISHVRQPSDYGSIAEDGRWGEHSRANPSALGRLQKLEKMLVDNDFNGVGIRELAHWGNGNGLYYRAVGVEGADSQLKMFHTKGYGAKSNSGLNPVHDSSLLNDLDPEDSVGIKKLEEQNYNTEWYYINVLGKPPGEAKDLAKAHREEMWRADHGSRLGYKGEPGGVPEDEVRGESVGSRDTGRSAGGGGRTGGGGGTPPTPEHVEASIRTLIDKHDYTQEWVDDVYNRNHSGEADKIIQNEANRVALKEGGQDRHALAKKEMKVEEAPTFVDGVTDPTHALRTAYVFGHKLREHGVEVSPKVMEGWQRLAAQARHAGGDSKRIEQEMKEFGNDFGGPEHLEAVAKKDDYIRMQTNEVNGLLGNPARQRAAWQDQNHNPHRSHTFDNETGEHTGTRYRQLDGTGKAKKREENYDDVAPGGSPLPGKRHNPIQQKPVVEEPEAAVEAPPDVKIDAPEVEEAAKKVSDSEDKKSKLGAELEAHEKELSNHKATQELTDTIASEHEERLASTEQEYEGDDSPAAVGMRAGAKFSAEDARERADYRRGIAEAADAEHVKKTEALAKHNEEHQTLVDAHEAAKAKTPTTTEEVKPTEAPVVEDPVEETPVDPDAPSVTDTAKTLSDAKAALDEHEDIHNVNRNASFTHSKAYNKMRADRDALREKNASIYEEVKKVEQAYNDRFSVPLQMRGRFENEEEKAKKYYTEKVLPAREKADKVKQAEQVLTDAAMKHFDETLEPAFKKTEESRLNVSASLAAYKTAKEAHDAATGTSASVTGTAQRMETDHGDAPFQPGLTTAQRSTYNQLHKDIQQHKLTAQSPEEREAGNATLDGRKQAFHDSLPSSHQGLDPNDISGSMVNHPHFGALAEEKAEQGNHAGQAWREHHEEKSRLTAEHARVTDELSKLHPQHDAFAHEQKSTEVTAAQQKLDDHVTSWGTKGSRSMGMPSPEELKGSNPHGDLEYHEGIGLVSKSAHNQILNNLQGHEGFLHTGTGEDGSGKPLVYHNDGVTPKEGHVLVTHGGVHPVRYNAQYSQEKDDGIDKDDERTLGLGHSIHHAITSEHPDIEHHANGVHIRSLENVTPQLSEHHTAQLAQQAPVSQPTPTTSTTPPTGEKRTALGKLGDFVGSVRRATKAGIQAQPTIGGTARAAGRGIGAANKFAGRMINEQEIATEAGQPAAGGWSGSNVIRGRAGHTPTATGRAVQGLKATFGTSAMKANAAAQHMENVSSVAQSHLQGTTPPPVPKSFGE